MNVNEGKSTKLSNVINITAQCDVVFLDIVTFVLTTAIFKNGIFQNWFI